MLEAIAQITQRLEKLAKEVVCCISLLYFSSVTVTTNIHIFSFGVRNVALNIHIVHILSSQVI